MIIVTPPPGKWFAFMIAARRVQLALSSAVWHTPLVRVPVAATSTTRFTVKVGDAKIAAGKKIAAVDVSANAFSACRAQTRLAIKNFGCCIPWRPAERPGSQNSFNRTDEVVARAILSKAAGDVNSFPI